LTGAGTSIVVRPAGAERETLAVALLCAAILLCAGGVVALRTTPFQTTAIGSWQIDTRDVLTAAEQGINADLRVAADDIRALLESGKIPTAEELAGDALPPFAMDATSQARGGHVWSTIPTRDGFAAWLGRSSAPQVAGSFLLRVAKDEAVSGDHAHRKESTARATIWLNPSASLGTPGLSNDALIASGWKEIVNRYDASVTRGVGR
jgi:hypothetical protein